MVKQTKLYDLLEVDPSASDADLKTAYKKGALKLHPDKNAGDPVAAEKFKDLSRAYEILQDPQKRQLYDQYGEEGLEQGGMNAEDLFAQFFGGFARPAPKKARPIFHVHKVSLEDMYRGKTSKLALQRSIICPSCDGRGGKEGAVKKCPGCDGTGVKTTLRQLGPMIQRYRTECPDCQAQGEIIREKDKCNRCRGKKTVVERQVLHVLIPKGVKNGHKIEFRGEGDQIPGIEPGDVEFEIQQKPHPRFQRKDDDLFYNVEIDLVTALAGGEIHIEHLDDRWLTVRLYPGNPIKPGQINVVRGQGMPSFRHHDYGDLYIHFDVRFPTAEEMRDMEPTGDGARRLELLAQILPPPRRQIEPPIDAMVEDMDLEEVDPRRQARAQGMAGGEEEEEDGIPHGAERMQCASQ